GRVVFRTASNGPGVHVDAAVGNRDVHTVQRSWRRPENTHTSVVIGRPVTRTAEPSLLVSARLRVDEVEVVDPWHRTPQVRALPPQGQEARAALLLREVHEPEL